MAEPLELSEPQDVEQKAQLALPGLRMDRNVTVSIGIAGCDNAASGYARLFERADAALYSAKHAGRNRVALAASESTSTS